MRILRFGGLASWLLFVWSGSGGRSNTATATLITSSDTDFHVLCPRQTIEKPFYLRIMPLGASITEGWLSSHGNGYRSTLRELLTKDGWPVNMVGGRKNGTMFDNEHEGTHGFRIHQAREAFDNSAHLLPNVLTINVGTNDAEYGTDQEYEAAVDRLKNLVTHIFAVSPQATVILSTLLPHAYPEVNEKILVMNIAIRKYVANSKNKHLVLAEMNNGNIALEDEQDKTHPTDDGYYKMAQIWYAAIKEAELTGALLEPTETEWADDELCVGLEDQRNTHP